MEPDSPDSPELSVDIVPQFGRMSPQHEDGDYCSLSPLDQVRFRTFCKRFLLDLHDFDNYKVLKN